MAVIGRSWGIGAIHPLAVAALFILILALPARADQSSDLRHRLSDIATALSSGNARQAMDAFDKEAFKGYDKLNGFFEGLTGAYQVDTQIEVADEESTAGDATLTVHWTLTLTDPGTGLTQSRDSDITVKLLKKKGAWRIVTFEPLDIFDPQMKR